MLVNHRCGLFPWRLAIWRLAIWRLAILLIASAANPAVWTSTPAAAEGLFESLFGTGSRAPAAPPQALSYASPAALVTAAHSTPPSVRTQLSAGSTRSADYCVRLCDGRFFPVRRQSAASSAQLCNAFCPSSETKIFSGGDIARATAADGTRYANLKNAFVFRNRLVSGCTCNGKDHFGLARIEPSADPTLRPGDMVATASGLKSLRQQ